MKKLFLFFFLIFLIFPKKVFGFNFLKYENNPLNINYINGYSSQLQSHIFKKDGYYFGIFAVKKPELNYRSLALFKSVDGVNFNMEKEIYNNGQDLSNPRFFQFPNNQIKIYFTTYDQNEIYRIYSLDCDNQFNCGNQKLVLDIDSSDFKETKGVFAGYPLLQENILYLFYGAWGQDGFKVRLAYSSDFENFYKCQNTLVAGGDGPFVFIKDSFLYLFSHQSNGSGIKAFKTSLPLSCQSSFEDLGYVLTRSQSYDANHMIFPSVVDNDNELYLYYVGLGGGQWRLSLAKDFIYKKPIIIIPGFMASWNKRAILYNENVSYNQWKLGAYVKEYKGLIESLRNLGYLENQDFFIFPYDWRKSVENIADDLKNFIDNLNIGSKKFNIVGHSLGGLVGRIYQQKYKNNNLEKLITVGSPHLGVVQSYKPLQYGEIERENTFLWLAQKIILILNKSGFESDKETIRNKFSVLFDLLPAFNFLKNQLGEEIDYQTLDLKNNLLEVYQPNFSEIFDVFTSIYGEKDNQTLAGFILNNQGKIVDQYFEAGDYLVLKKSANQDSDSQSLYLDHGEIIYKKEAIKKIFDLLGLNYQDSQIIEGDKTKISSSLIFMIRSPAVMTVNYQDMLFEEDEGILFIDDAQTGEYDLKVKGVDIGNYQLIIGQITANNDVWEIKNGEIKTIDPEQIDSYLINYNQDYATEIFPSPTTTITPSLNPTPTITPSITPTITPTIFPTLNWTPTPILINNQNSSTNNSFSSTNQNSSTSSNSNQIFSSPNLIPTQVLFSSVKDNNNLQNENQEKPVVLGEKTEEKKDENLFKNNNKKFFIILTMIIIGSSGFILYKKITSNK